VKENFKNKSTNKLVELQVWFNLFDGNDETLETLRHDEILGLMFVFAKVKIFTFSKFQEGLFMKLKISRAGPLTTTLNLTF
jgi:hypothetical protein